MRPLESRCSRFASEVGVPCFYELAHWRNVGYVKHQILVTCGRVVFDYFVLDVYVVVWNVKLHISVAVTCKCNHLLNVVVV